MRALSCNEDNGDVRDGAPCLTSTIMIGENSKTQDRFDRMSIEFLTETISSNHNTLSSFKVGVNQIIEKFNQSIKSSLKVSTVPLPNRIVEFDIYSTAHSALSSSLGATMRVEKMLKETSRLPYHHFHRIPVCGPFETSCTIHPHAQSSGEKSDGQVRYPASEKEVS